MDAFLFKKTFSRIFFPLPLCLELLAAGLLLLWFTGWRNLGRVLVTVGFALLVLFGSNAFSDHLLWSLEKRYEPFRPTGGPDGGAFPLIVVLGGGHADAPAIPVSSQPESSTLFRLTEGIRLHRIFPGSKLLLSGGRMNSTVSDAEVMADLAKSFGVPGEDLLLEDRSRDTEDQARLIKPLVGTEPFLLVTSAWHMPRAMFLFEREGAKPTAAPTDYLARQGEGFTQERFLPSPRALLKATKAVYEYLGFAWLKVRDWGGEAFLERVTGMRDPGRPER